MNVKLDLRIINCSAKANIRVEKRSRSPEQIEQTVPAKRFCHQLGVALNLTPDYSSDGLHVKANIKIRNSVLNSLEETVEYSDNNKFSINIPKLFVRIYENNINDLKFLKHDKDFQQFCLELQYTHNGSIITHFIADSVNKNENHRSLLDFFDFIPLKMWAKHNTLKRSVSHFSNHPQIVMREKLACLDSNLTNEKVDKGIHRVGEYIIELLKDNKITAESFKDIWILTKKNMSNEHYENLIKKFRCEFDYKSNIEYYDEDFFQENISLIHAAVLFGNVAKFKLIANYVYQDKGLLREDFFVRDSLFFYCGCSSNPSMFFALKEVISEDEYLKLLNSDLEIDLEAPYNKQDFLYGALRSDNPKNIEYFYNSLSQDQKNRFGKKILETLNYSDEFFESNVLLWTLHRDLDLPENINCWMSTLLQIQPRILTFLYHECSRDCFSQCFDEHKLHTLINQFCPLEYNEFASGCLELRLLNLTESTTSSYISIRSEESFRLVLQYQDDKTISENVIAFWIKQDLLEIINNLDASFIIFLAKQSPKFFGRFFRQKVSRLEFYDCRTFLTQVQKLNQLLGYQPYLFGNILEALIPNPRLDETAEALRFYARILVNHDELIENVLSCQNIARIILQPDKKCRNILFEILKYQNCEAVFDFFLSRFPNETWIMLKQVDTSGKNCLADCSQFKIIKKISEKYPDEFKDLVLNLEGKESLVATYFKHYKDDTSRNKKFLFYIASIYSFLQQTEVNLENFFGAKRESGESVLSILASLNKLPPNLVDKEKKQLLNFKEFFNWVDADRNNVFHLAATHNNTAFFRAHYSNFIKYQYNKNSLGQTPLTRAYEGMYKEVFNFLSGELKLSKEPVFLDSICALSLEIFLEPVVAVIDGTPHIYEKSDLEALRDSCKEKGIPFMCPKSRKPIKEICSVVVEFRNTILNMLKQYQDLQELKSNAQSKVAAN